MNNDNIENLGLHNVTNLFRLLLNKSTEFTQHEVAWLKTTVNETVYMEVDNLQRVVTGIAGLVDADEIAGNFQSKNSVSTLLYSVAHQLDVLNGMVSLGNEIDMHCEMKKIQRINP